MEGDGDSRPPAEPNGAERRGFAAWWATHRDRISILAIGAVAVGGIVCMFLTVLVLVLG